MKKENVEDLKVATKIYSGAFSNIFLLGDGRVFKMFTGSVMDEYIKSGINIEAKLLESEKISSNKEFIFPISIVYNMNKVVGYTMEYIEDINFNEYDERVSKQDQLSLEFYCNNYEKLEKVIKKGHSLDLYFPDLCTCNNIYITKNGDFRLGDYDGFQIGTHSSINISSLLGNQKLFWNSKFVHNNLFTEEIDKYSLLVLYFIDTFGICINSSNFDSKYKLIDTLNVINLFDEKIISMIARTLSADKKGSYVSEIACELARNYTLKPIYKNNQLYHKILEKK